MAALPEVINPRKLFFRRASVNALAVTPDADVSVLPIQPHLDLSARIRPNGSPNTYNLDVVGARNPAADLRIFVVPDEVARRAGYSDLKEHDQGGRAVWEEAVPHAELAVGHTVIVKRAVPDREKSPDLLRVIITPEGPRELVVNRVVSVREAGPYTDGNQVVDIEQLTQDVEGAEIRIGSMISEETLEGKNIINVYPSRDPQRYLDGKRVIRQLPHGLASSIGVSRVDDEYILSVQALPAEDISSAVRQGLRVVNSIATNASATNPEDEIIQPLAVYPEVTKIALALNETVRLQANSGSTLACDTMGITLKEIIDDNGKPHKVLAIEGPDTGKFTMMGPTGMVMYEAGVREEKRREARKKKDAEEKTQQQASPEALEAAEIAGRMVGGYFDSPLVFTAPAKA